MTDGRLTDGHLTDARPAEQEGHTRKAKRRVEAESRQAIAKKRRANEKKRSKLEAEIERFEMQQKTLAAQLEDPDTYTTPGKPMELNRELTRVAETLKILYAEWDQAASNEECRTD